MTNNAIPPNESLRGTRPVGYGWLVEKYALPVAPHWRWTFVGESRAPRELHHRGCLLVVLPSERAPADDDLEQLLFALRYDGVSLAVARELFRVVDLGEAIAAEVRRRPTSAYARRAWYLYETLTGRRLAVPDLEQGNYVPLLDPMVHVTGPVRKHRRQRIDVNLLGTPEFAPVVRWTDGVRPISAERLVAAVHAALASLDGGRGDEYVASREAINASARQGGPRFERFVRLLTHVDRIDALSKPDLVRLHSALVDERFADRGWRSTSSWVGEAFDLPRPFIDYVGPGADELDELMRGWSSAARALIDSELDPVLVAAVLSFGLLFVRPFTDGNGRLQRWLVHWVLARRQVVPGDLPIPLSAVMLRRRRELRGALGQVSAGIMPHVPYEIARDGAVVPSERSGALVRHLDLTPVVEALWTWLCAAVEQELPGQIAFATGFERSRHRVADLVDMPDASITALIRLWLRNGGRLPPVEARQNSPLLTDSEIAQIDGIIRRCFAGGHSQ